MSSSITASASAKKPIILFLAFVLCFSFKWANRAIIYPPEILFARSAQPFCWIYWTYSWFLLGRSMASSFSYKNAHTEMGVVVFVGEYVPFTD